MHDVGTMRRAGVFAASGGVCFSFGGFIFVFKTDGHHHRQAVFFARLTSKTSQQEKRFAMINLNASSHWTRSCSSKLSRTRCAAAGAAGLSPCRLRLPANPALVACDFSLSPRHEPRRRLISSTRSSRTTVAILSVGWRKRYSLQTSAPARGIRCAIDEARSG